MKKLIPKFQHSGVVDNTRTHPIYIPSVSKENYTPKVTLLSKYAKQPRPQALFTSDTRTSEKKKVDDAKVKDLQRLLKLKEINLKIGTAAALGGIGVALLIPGLNTAVNIGLGVTGGLNLLSDNGIKKTADAVHEGDYLGAVQSGLGDLLDLGMLKLGANSVRNIPSNLKFLTRNIKLPEINYSLPKADPKVNRKFAYRVINDEGLLDIVNSGYIRPKQTGPYAHEGVLGGTWFKLGSAVTKKNPTFLEVGKNRVKPIYYDGDYLIEVSPLAELFPKGITEGTKQYRYRLGDMQIVPTSPFIRIRNHKTGQIVNKDLYTKNSLIDGFTKQEWINGDNLQPKVISYLPNTTPTKVDRKPLLSLGIQVGKSQNAAFDNWVDSWNNKHPKSLEGILYMPNSTLDFVTKNNQFTPVYTINPGTINSEYMSDVYLNRLSKAGYSLFDPIPMQERGFTLVKSPHKRITDNNKKQSILGYFTGRPGTAGVYNTTSDISMISPETNLKVPSVLFHERNMHGTDNVISALGAWEPYENFLNKLYKESVDGVQMDRNVSELNLLKESANKKELRATIGEIVRQLYIDVGKMYNTKLKGNLANLTRLVEEYIDKMPESELLTRFENINGYGKDYSTLSKYNPDFVKDAKNLLKYGYSLLFATPAFIQNEKNNN